MRTSSGQGKTARVRAWSWRLTTRSGPDVATRRFSNRAETLLVGVVADGVAVHLDGEPVVARGGVDDEAQGGGPVGDRGHPRDLPGAVADDDVTLVGAERRDVDRHLDAVDRLAGQVRRGDPRPGPALLDDVLVVDRDGPRGEPDEHRAEQALAVAARRGALLGQGPGDEAPVGRAGDGRTRGSRSAAATAGSVGSTPAVSTSTAQNPAARRSATSGRRVREVDADGPVARLGAAHAAVAPRERVGR